MELTGVSGQPQQVHCNFLELETQSACVASLSRERPCGTHWRLRSASAGSLQLPRARNTVGGLHSFSVTGTFLWNSLPAALWRWEMMLPTFKQQLKSYLFHFWTANKQKWHSTHWWHLCDSGVPQIKLTYLVTVIVWSRSRLQFHSPDYYTTMPHKFHEIFTCTLSSDKLLNLCSTIAISKLQLIRWTVKTITADIAGGQTARNISHHWPQIRPISVAFNNKYTVAIQRNQPSSPIQPGHPSVASCNEYTSDSQGH